MNKWIPIFLLTISLSALRSALALPGTAVIRPIRLDPHKTSVIDCSLKYLSEPAGVLTMTIEGKQLSKRIYSDLCRHPSALWFEFVFIDKRDIIVGLSEGEEYADSERLSFSTKWRPYLSRD